MEELETAGGRVVKVQFDFDRNGQQMLAQAYQLLADLSPSERCCDSVQTSQRQTPTQSRLQEVNR